MVDFWIADLVVLIHFSFVLFVVFGALLLFWSKKIIWLHLPAAIWGALIEFTGWICPLTPLENRLRLKAGKEVYEGNFIDYYIMPILYPDYLSRNLQFLLGTLVILVNALLYWFAFRYHFKRQA